MRISYAVYDREGKEVKMYFDNFGSAKDYAIQGDYVVKLVGPAFGEGYHAIVRKAVEVTRFTCKCKIVNKLGD